MNMPCHALPQVVNGILQVILSTSYNINKEHHRVGATIINDVVLSFIVIITTVNVVIGVFDMRDPSEQGAESLTTDLPVTAGLQALALHSDPDPRSDLYDLQTS